MLRKLLSLVLLVLVAATTFVSPAFAGDAANGAGIFNANCAACHAGGRNAVNPTKTLQKADLDAYGKNTVAAIVTQVTNGNGAMPAFGGRLSAEQIEDVATYVLEQSEKGW